jgi:hypothetical protein
MAAQEPVHLSESSRSLSILRCFEIVNICFVSRGSAVDHQLLALSLCVIALRA